MPSSKKQPKLSVEEKSNRKANLIQSAIWKENGKRMDSTTKEFTAFIRLFVLYKDFNRDIDKYSKSDKISVGGVNAYIRDFLKINEKYKFKFAPKQMSLSDFFCEKFKKNLTDKDKKIEYGEFVKFLEEYLKGHHLFEKYNDIADKINNQEGMTDGQFNNSLLKEIQKQEKEGDEERVSREFNIRTSAIKPTKKQQTQNSLEKSADLSISQLNNNDNNGGDGIITSINEEQRKEPKKMQDQGVQIQSDLFLSDLERKSLERELKQTKLDLSAIQTSLVEKEKLLQATQLALSNKEQQYDKLQKANNMQNQLMKQKNENLSLYETTIGELSGEIDKLKLTISEIEEDRDFKEKSREVILSGFLKEQITRTRTERELEEAKEEIERIKNKLKESQINLNSLFSEFEPYAKAGEHFKTLDKLVGDVFHVIFGLTDYTISEIGEKNDFKNENYKNYLVKEILKKISELKANEVLNLLNTIEEGRKAIENRKNGKDVGTETVEEIGLKINKAFDDVLSTIEKTTDSLSELKNSSISSELALSSGTQTDDELIDEVKRDDIQQSDSSVQTDDIVKVDGVNKNNKDESENLDKQIKANIMTPSKNKINDMKNFQTLDISLFEKLSSDCLKKNTELFNGLAKASIENYNAMVKQSKQNKDNIESKITKIDPTKERRFIFVESETNDTKNSFDDIKNIEIDPNNINFEFFHKLLRYNLSKDNDLLYKRFVTSVLDPRVIEAAKQIANSQAAETVNQNTTSTANSQETKAEVDNAVKQGDQNQNFLVKYGANNDKPVDEKRIDYSNMVVSDELKQIIEGMLYKTIEFYVANKGNVFPQNKNYDQTAQYQKIYEMLLRMLLIRMSERYPEFKQQMDLMGQNSVELSNVELKPLTYSSNVKNNQSQTIQQNVNEPKIEIVRFNQVQRPIDKTKEQDNKNNKELKIAHIQQKNEYTGPAQAKVENEKHIDDDSLNLIDLASNNSQLIQSESENENVVASKGENKNKSLKAKSSFSFSFAKINEDEKEKTFYTIDNGTSFDALKIEINEEFVDYIEELSEYLGNSNEIAGNNIFERKDDVKVSNLKNELEEKEELLNDKEKTDVVKKTLIEKDIKEIKDKISDLEKEPTEATIGDTLARKAKKANIEFGTIATMTYNKDAEGNLTDKATISLLEFGDEEKNNQYISFTELELSNGDIVRIRDNHNDKIKNFLKEGQTEEEMLKNEDFIRNDLYITIQRKGSDKEELIGYDQEIAYGTSCSDLFDLPKKVRAKVIEKDLEVLDKGDVKASMEQDTREATQESSSEVIVEPEEEQEQEQENELGEHTRDVINRKAQGVSAGIILE